ncbi:MAG: GNAT family N-acetyltransferase, partial [Propionivibrio sp.]
METNASNAAQLASATTPSTKTRKHQPARLALSVGLAINEREIFAAQKLRYQIFAEELGARLTPKIPGVDQDIFDPYCEHLVVRNNDT